MVSFEEVQLNRTVKLFFLLCHRYKKTFLFCLRKNNEVEKNTERERGGREGAEGEDPEIRLI